MNLDQQFVRAGRHGRARHRRHVTHNMQQAARLSDYTAFMYLGHLVEYGITKRIFVKPELRQTEDYITGRFG